MARSSEKPATPRLPKNWPPHIAFVTRPVYSGITPAQRRQLQTQPGSGRPLSEIPPLCGFGPSPLVAIEPITDAAHPAQGQRGLFAARDLAAGSFILPYVGTYHSGSTSSPAAGGKKKEEEESDYDLWLDRDADVAVDARDRGNEARFVNDFRGTGGADARLNAEFREVWDPRRGERAMAVFVLPRRSPSSRGGSSGGRSIRGGGQRSAMKSAVGAGGIAKGEEILVSYGKGFWEMRREKDKETVGEAVGEEEKETEAAGRDEGGVGAAAAALASLKV